MPPRATLPFPPLPKPTYVEVTTLDEQQSYPYDLETIFFGHWLLLKDQYQIWGELCGGWIDLLI